jgi:hypothetical protein
MISVLTFQVNVAIAHTSWFSATSHHAQETLHRNGITRERSAASLGCHSTVSTLGGWRITARAKAPAKAAVARAMAHHPLRGPQVILGSTVVGSGVHDTL